ncbi:carbon storage regulator [Rhodanobacter denitrificans]|uniref:Carbon storage regulator (Could also regulate swarming and quorum sensing) n=1 Tax=Rhodanobacter denitrificans TaxID=666685 RepID=M4NN39_9GAMM|nr:carbon storage regulator [Rhodanobacter denitrificans]AGG89116.1 carbon storage regulator (could also regulate swarming and quorum sensing) [Rhodanobacter denitrificans]UJJ52940.1 carbon storage regulator [Rhodanobacter denitrificans]
MLSLRRRQGESILIGSDIEVRVAAVRGGVVYVDILAPSHIAVDRKEVRLGLASVKRRAGKPEEKIRHG